MAMVPIELFALAGVHRRQPDDPADYGALGTVLFFLVLNLQVTSGYGAIEAGVATLPITLAMLLLSARFSRLSARSPARALLMTVGPMVCGGGTLLLSRWAATRRTGPTCCPGSWSSPWASRCWSRR